ncbi:hypothetical protein [Agarilytica rhodophyticola]|uniref:hypothetical protein n=1 Tax=Agarilytica rhodophyticola TaxID=1737490 RepID=UPI000B3452B7|nr:hypothetical protein [Agarilytica rhodophyticola]
MSKLLIFLSFLLLLSTGYGSSVGSSAFEKNIDVFSWFEQENENADCSSDADADTYIFADIRNNISRYQAHLSYINSAIYSHLLTTYFSIRAPPYIFL